MKKITLIAVVAAMASLAVQGQGLVTFANSAAAGSKISTNTIVGGPATGLTAAIAGTFYYALFYSVAATTVNGSSAAVVGAGTYAFNDPTHWTFAGGASPTYTDNGQSFSSSGYATNTATAGRVLGLASDAVGGLTAGGTAQFVVIGWSANIGSTWQQLQAFLALPTGSGLYYAGESAVSPSIGTGDNSLATTPVILAASGAVTGFTLGVVPVPEPSTMALAGLGGLAALLFRRKKA